MQNRRKEDQGYIISLILTFAARWVQLFFAFLGSMIPSSFKILFPLRLLCFSYGLYQYARQQRALLQYVIFSGIRINKNRE